MRSRWRTIPSLDGRRWLMKHRVGPSATALILLLSDGPSISRDMYPPAQLVYWQVGESDRVWYRPSHATLLCTGS